MAGVYCPAFSIDLLQCGLFMVLLVEGYYEINQVSLITWLEENYYWIFFIYDFL